MSKKTAWWAALTLVGMSAAPAQTDPGLSTKPAGLTLTGEKIAPDVKPPDLSRPEPVSLNFVATEEEQEFLRAAEDGQTWAKARLGIIYVNTPDDPARMELGRRMLDEAAGQDSTDALFELATMALAGRGMERSPSTAFDYMRRAAELGMPEAQYELASMYSEGRGIAPDQEAALVWARQAAARGNLEAQHAVAITLLRRAASPEQTNEGLGLLKEAATKKHREAQMVLAGILARGEFGMAKDESAAEMILQTRARQGDADFQFGLATLYLYGEAFALKRDEGIAWLRKSAERGHMESINLLSDLRSKGSVGIKRLPGP